jgi:hypothetical protein
MLEEILPNKQKKNLMKNQEIRETIEHHLPQTENKTVWDILSKPLAVAEETPIDMAEVWKALNTTVTAARAHELWLALNRPISWPFKA